MPASPLSLARQVDSICERFESAWKAGQRPSIEAQLSQVPPEQRSALLKALLQLEVELLTRSRQAPDAASYRARFPEHAAVVEAVLREVAAQGTVLASSPPPPTADPPVPKTIGRFEVLERLGHGAFGQVFRARDPDLDREVAIKVPLRSVLASEPDIDRFLREAQAAGALQHPNVCPVYEIGRHGKHPFIVMPVIRGQSLAALLRNRQGPVPVKQGVGIIRKLALALQVAHDRGIIHRDLKLANVMTDSDRKDVVIMDFGLARRTAPGDSSQTREGTVMGSPAYMSPEQARGDIKNVGPRSDQYSLGVMLYELLTGRLPFLGNANEVLGKVLHVQPDPPSKHRPGLDPALEAICLQAMAKDPRGRFASMTEFAEALGRWLNDAPAASPPAPTLPQGSGAAVDTVAQIGKHLETLEERQRSHTEAAVAAGVQRSSRNMRRMLLLVGLPVALLLGVVALGVGYVAMREPGETHIDNSVTVHLHGIPFLDDGGVVFTLDGKTVAAKKLQKPIQIAVGEHELVIKRGKEVVETRRFHVAAGEGTKEAPAAVVVPVPEPEGEAGKELFVLKHPAPWGVVSAAFTPEGGRVLSVINFTQDRRAEFYLWKLGEDKELKRASEPLAHRVAVSADGKRFVLATGENARADNTPSSLVVWDLDPPADLKRIVFDGAGNPFDDLAVSRDGSKIFASRAGFIALFNAESGKAIFRAGNGTVNQVGCFTADERRLLIGANNDVSERDAATGKLLRTFENGHTERVSCIACSADGRRAVSGSSGAANTMRVWDLEAGKAIRTLAGHDGGILSVAMSPDGRFVLSGSADGTARVWDADSGKEVYRFRNHTKPVTAVAFSPGGRRALSAGWDGTVRVWQLPAR